MTARALFERVRRESLVTDRTTVAGCGYVDCRMPICPRCAFPLRLQPGFYVCMECEGTYSLVAWDRGWREARNPVPEPEVTACTAMRLGYVDSRPPWFWGSLAELAAEIEAHLAKKHKLKRVVRGHTIRIQRRCWEPCCFTKGQQGSFSVTEALYEIPSADSDLFAHGRRFA